MYLFTAYVDEKGVTNDVAREMVSNKVSDTLTNFLGGKSVTSDKSAGNSVFALRSAKENVELLKSSSCYKDVGAKHLIDALEFHLSKIKL